MHSNHVRKWLLNVFRVWLLGVSAVLTACVPIVVAHAAGNSFNVQVSPSPLVLTLTPGQTQTATVTVRNFSNHVEHLQPGLNGLRLGPTSENIGLQSALPGGVDNWVSFSPSSLTLGAGQSAPLTVSFDTPEDVGFSYEFGITLTSLSTTIQNTNGTNIKPEVIIFCLLNINRPGAKSQLAVMHFAGDKNRYAFLPANFTLQLKNTGNVIEQPTGTLFIQRSFDDQTPLATLPINNEAGYILPGTTRNFTTTWNSGFPVYVTQANGKKHLVWDWKHLNELRLGKYIAKAVVVYNNGQQEVPLTATFSFWIIPWWLLSIAILTIIILVMGLIGWGWLLFKGTKKVKGFAGYGHSKKK